MALVARKNGLDAAHGQASLVQLGLDAASTAENTTLHGTAILANSLHDRVGSDLDETEERHVVATAFDHVFLESVRSVTSTDDKVDLSGRQVGSHLAQGRSTILAGAEDCLVAVGYTWVHLDDRVDVVLISLRSIDLLGLLQNDLHHVNGCLRAEAANDTARELLAEAAVERRTET